MIRKILGLVALAALLGPVSCLDDEGPGRFSTKDTCVRGDVEGCSCGNDSKSFTGVRTCGTDLRFSTECRCPGCSVAPDCSQCGDDCFESCMCQTTGQEAVCHARCDDVADASQKLQ